MNINKFPFPCNLILILSFFVVTGNLKYNFNVKRDLGTRNP